MKLKILFIAVFLFSSSTAVMAQDPSFEETFKWINSKNVKYGERLSDRYKKEYNGTLSHVFSTDYKCFLYIHYDIHGIGSTSSDRITIPLYSFKDLTNPDFGEPQRQDSVFFRSTIDNIKTVTEYYNSKSQDKVELSQLAIFKMHVNAEKDLLIRMDKAVNVLKRHALTNGCAPKKETF